MTLLEAYAWLTRIAAPIIGVHLRLRAQRGKEDAARINERFGKPTHARPQGKLLWVHGASIGETLSALSFLGELQQRFPQWNIVLTSGTVTSAHLLKTRLPAGAIHQFMPVDTPQAVAGFLSHWQPDAGLLLESELWPNMLMACKARGIPLALINARMSETSLRNWGYAPEAIAELLSGFAAIYAQTEADARRYETLGAKQVACVGNLKEDAKPLQCDAQVLEKLHAQLGARPVFLCASIHPGEEAIIAEAASITKQSHPDALIILVPRHPEKAKEMEANISLRTSRRTLGESLDCDVYIADTIGELGLWYRLARSAFLGGSLIPHGGQNPIEAVQLGVPVCFGPHMFNFESVARELLAANAALQVSDAKTLAAAWLKQDARAANATAWLAQKPPVVERLLDALAPMLGGA